jgi:putative endonuclease
MVEFVVYVLKSKSSGRHYVGYTSNLIARFKSHNELATKGFTTRFRPWEVIWIEIFSEKATARTREKFLKTGKGRDWMIKNIEGY